MAIFSSLNRHQKEAIGLLQIGTFLEYFDLMLYVHMAVFLNELFFPKTDPHTSALLAAFAFCSTWVLRPFGALIFGWIGDNIGRKSTVVITTMMMALSCVIMANAPTYAQIGIGAAWIITICRVMQGLSSMGERICAEIYLTETIKGPVKYPAVGLVSVAAAFGAVFALCIAVFVTNFEMPWRSVFWIGSCIAVVGSIARVKLRETPDFYQKRSKLEAGADFIEKINYQTVLKFLLMQLPWAVWFFFVYIYCAQLLKHKFGFSADQIILNNLIVSIFQLANVCIASYLSQYFNSLKILKVKFYFLCLAIFLIPYILNCENLTPNGVMSLQSIFILFAYDLTPATPTFFKYIPVMKRVTSSTASYAIARAIGYIVTSFGLVYLTEIFGHFGLWCIMIPISALYIWSLNYFEKLEEQSVLLS